jgi:hypothetical protein
MPKYYTLQEANATLTIIRPLMEEMQKIRLDILANQPDAWRAVERSAGNGGNAALSKTVESFDRLDALLHQVQDMGVEIKDLDTGLLDFLALRNGREVYLCWRIGEDEILFWHEIEAGFAGRQSIDDF